MKYSGKPYSVKIGQDELYRRITNLSEIRDRMDSLPDDLKARMGTVEFPDDDTLSFSAPGVGTMVFKIAERTPVSSVRFLCDTGMMPINVVLDLEPVNADETNVVASIEADIPMMLRPLIGGKLQEAADKFGEIFGQLNA